MVTFRKKFLSPQIAQMLASWSSSDEAAKKPQLNSLSMLKTADPTLTFARTELIYPMFKIYGLCKPTK